MTAPKKVAAIHDISGLGRCSLTVIIPVLSAMGVQVCPVPTAVLSAHTGYGEFVMRDLTDYIDSALDHYKRMGVKFDCVYSGFLASSEQIDHCLDFFASFPEALKVVDPVMVADIITPNLTEAAILLGERFPEGAVSASTMKSWLVRLSQLGPKTVVITSVPLLSGGIATVGYDSERGSFWKITGEYVPISYSGSGDMFASVLVGGILGGDSLPIAMNRATSFTTSTIKTTYGYGTHWTDGIMFEPQLFRLRSEAELNDYTNL